MTEGFFCAGINVEQRRRPTPELGCAVLLYGVIFAQVVMSFVIFGSKNTDVRRITGPSTHPSFVCASGYVDVASCPGSSRLAYEDLDACVTQDLCQMVQECVGSRRRLGEPEAQEVDDTNGTAFAEHLGTADALRRLAEETGPAPEWLLERRELARRRLQSASSPPKDVWDFFETYVYIPLVLFLCVAILAVAWLVFLQRAAKVAIWGTIAVEVVFLIAVFIWYKVDFDVFNWGAVVAAALVILGAVLVRSSISHAAVIMSTAMDGLSANKRIFAVCGLVQVVWILYFALWIAALVEMHMVKEVGPRAPDLTGGFMPRVVSGAPQTGQQCTIREQSWLGGPTRWVWIVCYYWATYFCRNVNLVLITANITGWYFKQEGYGSFWLKALPWSVGVQAGGTAMASAIMGAGEYLMQRIGSTWQLVFSLLLPWNWILVCVAYALKTVLQTFTKFGVIAMTLSGKGFCESAGHGFQVLRSRLGQAVVTDYMGSRVMGWFTYMIGLGVAFATWAWADDVQGIMTFAHLPPGLMIAIILGMAYLLMYPFATLVLVVMLEGILSQFLGGSSGELRARLNSIMACLLLGSITVYILGAVSQIVVSAMDVVLFCFAVEEETSERQERFQELYGSIKAGIVQGQVAGPGQGVVQGTPAGGAPPAKEEPARAADPPVVVVGAKMHGNAVP